MTRKGHRVRIQTFVTNRARAINRAAGGVPDSCHLSGEAFDCYFPGQMNEAVMAAMADLAIRRGFGVIRYPQRLFCHFQIPPRNDFGE